MPPPKPHALAPKMHHGPHPGPSGRPRPRPLEVKKYFDLRRQAFDDAQDPIIVNFASTLARPFAPDDYLTIVREIFRWVRDGIRFQRDPGQREEFASAATILNRGWDDCDGKIKLAVSLMRSLGIDADVQPVWNQEGFLSHVQLRVRFPGSEHIRGSKAGWLYGEITIRGAELTQNPMAIASRPETGKLPLSGGPDFRGPLD